MIEARKILFAERGGVTYPRDPELFQMADEFCKRWVAGPVPLNSFRDVWAIVRTQDGKPIEVLNVAGVALRLDMCLFRSKPGEDATRASLTAISRVLDFYRDQGLRGSVALVQALAEEPEDRCPGAESLLERYGCKPANRFEVVI